MEWIIGFLGLTLGGLLGYFFGERRTRQVAERIQASLHELDRARAEERSGMETRIQMLDSRQDEMKTLLAEKETQLSLQNQDNAKLAARLSALQTTEANLQEKIQLQLEEVKRQEERFRTEFSNLANEILKKNTNELTLFNKDNLAGILNPLKEQIERFEKRVNDVDSQGAERHGQLRIELEKLRDLNTNLQAEAGNLTRALKGDTKSQGNWGEMILYKVLEVSGLEKDREYRVQSQLSGSDEKNVRPDVIVNLPDNKHIIIDSKVSLTAYDNYVNADNEEDRRAYLQQHIQSVRNHIRQLSDKQYQSIELLDSPDFVLLFMAIEPAFSLSMREKPELFNEAWERKIVIVSPTTLLATLRTVASIWKHEKQTQNAMEIARVGGGLYDKFVGLVDDLNRIGNQIDTTRKTYDEAMNKLKTGRGNLVRKVEQLRELGVKVTKDIPQQLLSKDELIFDKEDAEDEI